MKNCGGRGKEKREILGPTVWAPPFGPPPFGAPPLRGPHFFWVWPVALRGPHSSGATLRGPTMTRNILATKLAKI